MKTKRQRQRLIERLLDEAFSPIQLPVNALPVDAYPDRALVGTDTGPTPPIPPTPSGGKTSDLPIGVYARRHKRRPTDDDEVFSMVLAVLDAR